MVLGGIESDQWHGIFADNFEHVKYVNSLI